MDFGTINNIEKKEIYKVIESLELTHKNHIEFIKCKGYNLDPNLTSLLENTNFLTDVFRRMLCVLIHKNFEFKETTTKDKFWHKRKVLKYFAKLLKQYPVFDVALIVYIKTLLGSSLNEIDKKAIRMNIFGKEPLISFLNNFSRKLGVVLKLFEFDGRIPEMRIYFEKNMNSDDGEEMAFVLKDGDFLIIYSKLITQNLYGENKN